MVWQDILITTATIIITYALIPQVHKGFKHKKPYVHTQTSLLTSIALYAIATAYLTLNLIISTVITYLTATLWLILFIQSIIYKK